MLSLNALHVEVSESAMPKYWITLCSEGNTRVYTKWPIRWCVRSRRLLVLDHVMSVSFSGFKFQQTHYYGYPEHANIRVSGENEFVAVVGMHPIDTEEATYAMCFTCQACIPYGLSKH
jgi:hypothetical protein